MPLAFMSRHLPKCEGDALFARNGVNTIATCAIVNSIVFIRDVGKKSTLHGIEVCNPIIV
jgi:hypothetical protein